MKKRRFSLESNADGFNTGSRNWLLHARYVRGEHSLCLDVADDLQKQYGNKHRYAHYIKGSVLADAGRLQEALERYHSCIRLHPQDPEPLKQVASCLSRQHRFQLSLEAYLEADKLSKHPDPDIYCALGFNTGSRNWLLHARYVRGEHSLCLDVADDLQKQYGNKHRYAHYIKGSVLADAGRLQEALERYHSCIRLHPQDPEPLKQVASCLSRQHRFQLSLEAYLEADKLSKHPDPDIYCALAECSWNLGELEKGVEWARSAVQAGGGERAGALLAKLLLACDDVQGALVAYDQALTTHACGADTLAAAGALRLRAGDPRRAFQLLGAALAQQPTQHAAALALAAMMLQHKDLDAALSRLKAALTAHPTCVAAHANLGMALLAKKKYIAALTCLQRASWAAPLSARAAHDLGVALLVCKRPASAFCRLATAAALQPFQPYTVMLIGIALERLGDSRADAAYGRALALAPDDPLLRLNVAGRHARAGRLREAAEEAGVTAELLAKEETADAQLTSSMVSLFELLNEAGLSRPTFIPNAEKELPALEAAQEEQFDPDEV